MYLSRTVLEYLSVLQDMLLTINILFTFLELLQDISLFGVVLVGVKNNGFWKVQIFQGLP